MPVKASHPIPLMELLNQSRHHLFDGCVLCPSGSRGFLEGCGFILPVKLLVLTLLHLLCQRRIPTVPSRSCGHFMGKASGWGLCGVHKACTFGKTWHCGRLVLTMFLLSLWPETPPLRVLGRRKLSFKKWRWVETPTGPGTEEGRDGTLPEFGLMRLSGH